MVSYKKLYENEMEKKQGRRNKAKIRQQKYRQKQDRKGFKNVTFLLPKEVISLIDKQADITGKSKNDIVSDAINDFFGQKQTTMFEALPEVKPDDVTSDTEVKEKTVKKKSVIKKDTDNISDTKRKIIELKNKGKSFQNIADFLNQNSYKKKRENTGPWTKQEVQGYYRRSTIGK